MRWRRPPPAASSNALTENFRLMNVLIVYAHSQETSFNGALLETCLTTLKAEGHDVQLSDLYAMGFNPVASAEDFKERRFPDHLQYDREQKHAVQRSSFKTRADAVEGVE